VDRIGDAFSTAAPASADNAEAQHNWGVVWRGKPFQEAIDHFRAALAIDLAAPKHASTSIAKLLGEKPHEAVACPRSAGESKTSHHARSPDRLYQP
jgi:hypothetical protein